MRYSAYLKYKASGIVWLGRVPSHWTIERVSGLFRFRSGGTPNTSEADYWTGDIPWVSAKDMKRIVVTDTEDHITEGAVAESATSLVPKGSVLLVTRSGILKHTIPVAVASRSVAINQDLKGLVGVDGRINSMFFAYWVHGHQDALLTLWRQQGATVESLDFNAIRATALPMPPTDEQRTIADFLDAQTAKLDTLVAKKRELIEKLKEKRTALISRTVTRGLPPEAALAAGLDPHPKPKPSGVDWFGELPESWRVAQLRRFTRFITSGSRGWAEHYSDEGALFIRIGNLTRHSVHLDLADVQYVDPPEGAEGERTRILAGDVLFSITAYLGSVAVADASVAGAYINQHIALVRLTAGAVTPRFVAYAALADVGQAQLAGQGYGGTKVQLGLDDVKSLWIPLPPAGEQIVIAEYLDRETAMIDALIAKIEAAIERLQEYRSALITAAVTGKIDVRGAGKERASTSAAASARV